MNKIKHCFKEASIEIHMLVLFLSVLAFCGATWIYANVSELLFYALIIVIMIVVIFDAYYAIHKTAENYLVRYQVACFAEIKKNLKDDYVRIYVFSCSNMDKSLEYYGKVDKDGLILVYGEDKCGKRKYQHQDYNYEWFLENFYVK